VAGIPLTKLTLEKSAPSAISIKSFDGLVPPNAVPDIVTLSPITYPVAFAVTMFSYVPVESSEVLVTLNNADDPDVWIFDVVLLVNVPIPVEEDPDIVTVVTSPLAVESSSITPVIVIVASFAGVAPFSVFPGTTKV
jgi:hypothetical protein